MVNDDVVKCPLCGGFTHIERPDLLAALQEPRIREQIENYITELLKSPAEELSGVGATHAGRDFQKMFTAGIRACLCGGAARRNKASAAQLHTARIRFTVRRQSC